MIFDARREKSSVSLRVTVCDWVTASETGGATGYSGVGGSARIKINPRRFKYAYT